MPGAGIPLRRLLVGVVGLTQREMELRPLRRDGEIGDARARQHEKRDQGRDPPLEMS